MKIAGAMVAGMIFSQIVFYSAFGQGGGPVDKGSNGTPTAGKVDPAAVAELERAQDMFRNEEGRDREAIGIAEGLLAIFRDNEDFNHLVDCLFLIGDAYYFLGEYEEAIPFMQQAADLGYRYFPDQMSSYPLKVVGECQFEIGQHEEALATFQSRVQRLRDQEGSDELVGAMFDVGGMLINVGRPREALEWLRDALEENNDRAAELRSDAGSTTEDKDGAIIDHAEITYHMAIAYFRLDDFEKARQRLDEARSFFKSMVDDNDTYGLKDRLVSVLDDLVNVCGKLGMDSEVERFRRERDEYNQ